MLTDGSLISSAVALHLQIGDAVKSSSFPTISSQISYIRQILTENSEKDNFYGQAARGEIPTVVTSHNKDEIASLIVLKRDHVPKARFVIYGGTEAHLVAPYLAESQIAVVLSPVLCTPASFDSIHCLTGAPLTNGTAAHVLHSYGVELGIGIPDNALARNLAWDAGWLAVTSPSESDLKGGVITKTQALAFVTSNLREIYGLNNKASVKADDDFLVYSGDPFDLKSRLVLIHSELNGLHTLNEK